MSYFIRPTDQQRAALWHDMLQRYDLPIIDGRARVGRRGQLVYDVDVRALDATGRARLAGLVAQQNGIGYYEARALVEGEGVAVPAVGCELIQGN